MDTTKLIDCTNITLPIEYRELIFDLPLLELENGEDMFNSSIITSFISELPKLNDGSRMFYNCASLETFKSLLPELENGKFMFADCHNLTTFNVPLPKLENGDGMFSISSLKEFNIELPKLKTGYGMFYNCNLSTSQINKILESLPTWDDGKEHIITFSECPGASECYPNIAISKGWEVEI